MATSLLSLALALAAGSTGQYAPGPAHQQSVLHRFLRGSGGFVMPDGPGNGWGFPNSNPDGYGWTDFRERLPLGGNRTSEYYNNRFNAVLPEQMFLPMYYNPYVTRGQRYIAYTGCGGDHPAGGTPIASANTPVHPYQDSVGTGPRVQVPVFSGRVEAPPELTGKNGLTP